MVAQTRAIIEAALNLRSHQDHFKVKGMEKLYFHTGGNDIHL